MSDVHVRFDGFVGVIEMRRPPHNFFDDVVVGELADAFEALDADSECRAIVLASEGRSFCAGADFSGRRPDPGAFADGAGTKSAGVGAASLYHEALRLFAVSTPVISAVHGAAIGGGMGLALAADFRITCEDATWSANFSRLGFHPGFALSVTLPELVGMQRTRRLLYSGRRIDGVEAAAIGLADECVAADRVRSRAIELGAELAASAPLAVRAIKATLDGERVDRLRAATDHELAEQVRLMATDDAREGIAAYAERRAPEFKTR